MSLPSNLSEICNCLLVPYVVAKTPLPGHCQDVKITINQEISFDCRLHIADSNAPLIIFFHGHRECLADYDEIGLSYINSGLNFLVTTYQGYGWSAGKATLSHIMSDMENIHAAIDLYCAENSMSGPQFVMGRSFGSLCALSYIKRFHGSVKGLILESPIVDYRIFAHRLGCKISDEKASAEEQSYILEKIRKIKDPTLILHGLRDKLVTVAEAEKLQSESGARTKQFFVIPGADHDSLIAAGGEHYFLTIKKFIDMVTGANTWRQQRRKFKNKKKEL